MALLTAEEYKQSLRDGRTVYYRGELVNDVTTHPVIGLAVEHAATDYRMAHDENESSLAVVNDDNGRYSRYYQIPRTPEDLLTAQRSDRAVNNPRGHSRRLSQGNWNRRTLRLAFNRCTYGP